MKKFHLNKNVKKGLSIACAGLLLIIPKAPVLPKEHYTGKQSEQSQRLTRKKKY